MIAAAIAVPLVAFGVSAGRISANPGGKPNAEACTGKVISTLAGEGITPREAHVEFIRQACARGESPEAVVQKVREAAGEA
jgi:hypothetical protein